MHKTIVKNPIFLIQYGGKVVVEWRDYDHLIEWWKKMRRMDIGVQFKRSYTYCEKLRGHRGHEVLWVPYNSIRAPIDHYEYILRYSDGNVIDPEQVEKDWEKTLPVWQYWKNNGAKRRWRFRQWYKSTCNMNERRAVEAWEDDEDAPKVRAKRNLRHLPNSWDDIPKSRNHDNNWKQYRKTQWKGG